MAPFSNVRPYLIQSFRNRIPLLAGWVVFTPLVLHPVAGLSRGLTALATLGVLGGVVGYITLSSYQRHRSKF
ncbi:hypothetical protein GCM10008957_55780 [Deinococcus ruber]|uniref:Uncharacterized protein n=1 Tax=Deinococcus ruber TaxID=1848197 RepID=A0A918FIM1_9DEIO|nr:hypothetical protein GCM10008957_55780 [Deinococcus ruber]